jgi:hypothetical protein
LLGGITVLVEYLFFGTTFPKILRFKKATFVSSGAGIYLLHVFLRLLNTGLGIDVLLIPIVGFLLFWLIGFFDVSEEQIEPSIDNKALLKGGLGDGEC